MMVTGITDIREPVTLDTASTTMAVITTSTIIMEDTLTTTKMVTMATIFMEDGRYFVNYKNGHYGNNYNNGFGLYKNYRYWNSIDDIYNDNYLFGPYYNQYYYGNNFFGGNYGWNGRFYWNNNGFDYYDYRNFQFGDPYFYGNNHCGWNYNGERYGWNRNYFINDQ